MLFRSVLPDLFREGAGVIAHGHMLPSGTFDADEVLAKHDQYYKPPGIGEKMAIRHGEPRDAALQRAPATASTDLAQPAAEHP